MADVEDAGASDFSQWLTCKACGKVMPQSEFYASNKARCKECFKARVRQNRAEKVEYYRAYDRKRYRDSPERKEQARKCSASVPMAKRVENLRERRRRSPEKDKARAAVARAVKSGTMEKQPCYFCGAEHKVEAHHPDYAHPLDVFWLCRPCHGKLHTINGDMRRG